jgi:ribosomal protein S18 acetylase RimI-like enzyme
MGLPIGCREAQEEAGGLTGGVMVQYEPAAAADIPAVRGLFLEYADSLGFDLTFQGFDAELASLPGKYAAPEGALIIARHDGAACACVALRRIDAECCEMKRLYVQPAKRGLGIGRQLVERILDAARERGYRRMRLDTLASMKSAVALYRSFGFRDIPPYIFNPIPGALYMERDLEEPGGR